MWDVLSGKYGEEGEKLIYRFSDRGNRDLGLRYDLTVPLSRVVAMYQNDLPRPFKRYQIQPVWRADKPGKGRFREFYQCDVDVVGSRNLLADAEVIQVSYEILASLGFRSFKIKLNSRKVLRGIVETAGCGLEMEAEVCRSIDKLDKIGFDGVREELATRGVAPPSIDRIMEIIKIGGTSQEVILMASNRLKDSLSAEEGIEELSTLRKYLEAMGVPPENLQLDIALARGLDYYTGPIFETVVDKPKIGSLSGGGRFDNLIGQMLGQPVPAVGNSVGLERIITVMDELEMYPAGLGFAVDVMICRFPDEDVSYTLQMAGRLRKAGFSTEVYLGDKNLRGQLGYASDKGIAAAVLAGGDERARGVLTVKDLRRQKQETISQDELIEKLGGIARGAAGDAPRG
jgi:histidyl-tRNA synthetase